MVRWVARHHHEAERRLLLGRQAAKRAAEVARQAGETAMVAAMPPAEARPGPGRGGGRGGGSQRSLAADHDQVARARGLPCDDIEFVQHRAARPRHAAGVVDAARGGGLVPEPARPYEISELEMEAAARVPDEACHVPQLPQERGVVQRLRWGAGYGVHCKATVPARFRGGRLSVHENVMALIVSRTMAVWVQSRGTLAAR